MANFYNPRNNIQPMPAGGMPSQPSGSLGDAGAMPPFGDYPAMMPPQDVTSTMKQPMQRFGLLPTGFNPQAAQNAQWAQLIRSNALHPRSLGNDAFGGGPMDRFPIGGGAAPGGMALGSSGIPQVSPYANPGLGLVPSAQMGTVRNLQARMPRLNPGLSGLVDWGMKAPTTLGEYFAQLPGSGT